MSGKKWVLLVAGSKNWENYQHQANVCGLYQIIKKHGIPDEQIVVMMYDDIAHNQENPTKGIIASVVDDSDVYSGVPKDYTGKDVTPKNFLAALQGDESTKTKVIKSGENDNIFIYMSGLGNEGTFEFPEESLCKNDLVRVINKMHQDSKVSKMVIFMTSSYSASMFGDLDCNVDVCALTACDTNIQSTPSDYDDIRKIYRSDKFSSTLLKFINEADINTETFHGLIANEQANNPEQNNGPCPCQFGNLEIRNCHLLEFLSK